MTTLRIPVFVPLPGSPRWTIEECTVSLDFTILPGEKRTRDREGCQPGAELDRGEIRFPDGSVAELDLANIEELLHAEIDDLEHDALEQAGRDLLEAEQCAAEEQHDREREDQRYTQSNRGLLMDA